MCEHKRGYYPIIERSFDYHLERWDSNPPCLRSRFSQYENTDRIVFEHITGVQLKDGRVMWSVGAPHHPALLEAEGLGREDTVSAFEIDRPNTFQPFKIAVIAAFPEDIVEVAQFIVASHPHPDSQLYLSSPDDWPDYRRRITLYQGKVEQFNLSSIDAIKRMAKVGMFPL